MGYRSMLLVNDAVYLDLYSIFSQPSSGPLTIIKEFLHLVAKTRVGPIVELCHPSATYFTGQVLRRKNLTSGSASN